MLTQTNTYLVPADKREQHARLLRRIRQVLQRLGCDHFEIYEEVHPDWSPVKNVTRFVQLMRFRDPAHHHAVQAAERADPAARDLIRELSELVDLPAQGQQGLFSVSYYSSATPPADQIT